MATFDPARAFNDPTTSCCGRDAADCDCPELRCVRCRKRPSEIAEYLDEEFTDGQAPDEFVREHEGTLNVETGEFACTECYIALGMPSNPYPQPQWTP